MKKAEAALAVQQALGEELAAEIDATMPQVVEIRYAGYLLKCASGAAESAFIGAKAAIFAYEKTIHAAIMGKTRVNAIKDWAKSLGFIAAKSTMEDYVNMLSAIACAPDVSTTATQGRGEQKSISTITVNNASSIQGHWKPLATAAREKLGIGSGGKTPEQKAAAEAKKAAEEKAKLDAAVAAAIAGKKDEGAPSKVIDAERDAIDVLEQGDALGVYRLVKTAPRPVLENVIMALKELGYTVTPAQETVQIGKGMLETPKPNKPRGARKVAGKAQSASA